KTVHDPSGGEIVEHGLDGGQLVLGLVVWKTRGKLVVETGRNVDRLARRELALRGDLDELLRHVADALLEPALLRLPGDAAQLVENNALGIRAVARQQLDILDRKI